MAEGLAPDPDHAEPVPGTEPPAVELHLAEPAPEPEREEPIVPTLLRQEKTYPGRFKIALLALGLVLGAALAGFVLLAQHHSAKPAPFAVKVAPTGAPVASSEGWHPICDFEFGCDRPHQIAAYVAPKYQLTAGKDAVGIIATRPTIPQADGTAADVPVIIERNDRGSRIVYTAPANDNTVQYDMCGYAAACTLGGTPSIQRGDLLRRQALELALLTFKYDTTVKGVLTFFPKPAKTTDPSYALFFRRTDYGRQLSQPLSATLGKQAVLRPGQMSDAQAQEIGKLTTPRVFKYEYRQTQQGFPILVLTPAAY